MVPKQIEAFLTTCRFENRIMGLAGFEGARPKRQLFWVILNQENCASRFALHVRPSFSQVAAVGPSRRPSADVLEWKYSLTGLEDGVKGRVHEGTNGGTGKRKSRAERRGFAIDALMGT